MRQRQDAVVVGGHARKGGGDEVDPAGLVLLIHAEEGDAEGAIHPFVHKIHNRLCIISTGRVHTDAGL